MNSIRELQIPHNLSDIYPYLTVSIGAASPCEFDTLNHDELLIQADRALYMAKKNGRNRFEHYIKEN